MQQWGGIATKTRRTNLPSFFFSSNVEIVEIPFLRQTIVRKLNDLKKEYEKKFTLCMKGAQLSADSTTTSTTIIRANRTDKTKRWCQHGNIRVPRNDVLLYPASVMDDTSHFLGHTRIAPVQLGYMGGGTETTGLGGKVGHLDYLLTSDRAHNSLGQRSYTEQMMRLPELGMIIPTSFRRLPMTARYGMPRVHQFNDLVMYSKFKYLLVPYHEISQIHPRFDSILARILHDVPNVHCMYLLHVNVGDSVVL